MQSAIWSAYIKNCKILSLQLCIDKDPPTRVFSDGAVGKEEDPPDPTVGDTKAKSSFSSTAAAARASSLAGSSVTKSDITVGASVEIAVVGGAAVVGAASVEIAIGAVVGVPVGWVL